MGPRALLAAVGVAAVFVWLSPTQAQQPASATDAKSSKTTAKAAPGPLTATTAKAVLDRYCTGCHSDSLKTGGLTLQNANLTELPAHAEQWEKVIRKLRAGAMPPQPMARDQVAIDGLATYLETTIDKAAFATPNPGRPSMHRLNRAEYENAVYDVFGLKVDADVLLPADDESSGFDNIADVLRMSPSLMERYLSASWNISREAVGNMAITPATQVYRVRPDLSQDQHIDGLPLGSKGGIRAEHNFPLDGEYTIKVRMWRNTFDLMLGVEDPHDLQIALDGKLLKSVRVGSRDDLGRMAENPGEFGIKLDEQLTVKLPVTAGPHVITAYSVLRSNAEVEVLIKPFDRANADSQLITGSPAFDRLTVEGPFKPTGVSDTPSRKAIFICRPAKESEEVACAKQILSTLGRKAFRRPLTDADTEMLLGFYQRGRNNGKSFDAGIESAIQFILASPEFLVRFEPDPDKIAPNTPYRVSDLALASRLSFFLWSTIPDEELIKVATSNKLHEPAVLKAQMQRMLKDPKSIAIVDNFAEQWLFLRNLKNSAPSLESFPDFDDNLRRAMREETRLFFESVLREDRSVMDLLNADYTFVNERLATHYGMKGIYGSQFRRVPVTDENRKGILGQASILTVTSYPNRTSPVQRGKWILTNILGIPPTPPPPDVPPLKANEEGAVLSLRQRMELHRENSVCAGCHKVMDPVGFALENFDGIGKYRAKDEGARIDPSGTMYDGSKVAGPADLRHMIAKRPEVFVGVMTERLLTYALGRPLRATDMPTVRKIVHDAAKNNYKIDTLIAGVIDSTPFQMRMSSARGPEGGQ